MKQKRNCNTYKVNSCCHMAMHHSTCSKKSKTKMCYENATLKSPKLMQATEVPWDF